MSETDLTAKVHPDVEKAFKSLWRKSNGSHDAIILKVDRDSHEVVLDEVLAQVSLEDIAEELPDTVPRFIIYSFKWERDTGRVQYPISLIYYKPVNTNAEFRMLYTRPVVALQNLFNVNKVFEVEDAEDMTEDWLLNNLKTAHF